MLKPKDGIQVHRARVKTVVEHVFVQHQMLRNPEQDHEHISVKRRKSRIRVVRKQDRAGVIFLNARLAYRIDQPSGVRFTPPTL
jgi:hypothetical protein